LRAEALGEREAVGDAAHAGRAVAGAAGRPPARSARGPRAGGRDAAGGGLARHAGGARARRAGGALRRERADRSEEHTSELLSPSFLHAPLPIYYVPKPWENARLLATLRTQAELSRALRAGRRHEALEARAREGATLPVAASRAMQAVLELAERAGPSDANVL